MPMSESLPPIENPEITAEAVRDLLAEDAAAICLVDCREVDEHAICRIEGAELVPLSTFAEAGPARLGAEERPIIVYCHHGMRSLQATMYLRNKGIESVWSMAGGIDVWSTTIDPDVPRY